MSLKMSTVDSLVEDSVNRNPHLSRVLSTHNIVVLLVSVKITSESSR